MFGIGTTELVLIVVLLALILGPRNLPKAARKVGEVKRELDRMRGSLTSALDVRGMLDPTREPPSVAPDERRPSDPKAPGGGDTR